MKLRLIRNSLFLTLSITLSATSCYDTAKMIEQESSYEIIPNPVVYEGDNLNFQFKAILPPFYKNPSLDSVHYTLSATSSNGEELLGKTSFVFTDDLNWDLPLEHIKNIQTQVSGLDKGTEITLRQSIHRAEKSRNLREVVLGRIEVAN